MIALRGCAYFSVGGQCGSMARLARRSTDKMSNPLPDEADDDHGTAELEPAAPVTGDVVRVEER